MHGFGCDLDGFLADDTTVFDRTRKMNKKRSDFIWPTILKMCSFNENVRVDSKRVKLTKEIDGFIYNLS